MRLALIALPLIGLLASGCGPTCASTCGKIYGQLADGNCNQRIPGEDPTASFDRCVEECEFALSQPGELNGYNPHERITSGEIPDLENEKQAAAWMDCVDELSCELLDDGFCAPI
ncbi:MAG: hypothetical protein EP330_16740 [Deltaproteobacteria bacterium]|nr:MAG: hypothetical protein EP330_16740 [Deltaproteobacteria bacterium]